MEEIWKDVVGFDGLYLVSNIGNVYSTTHRRLVSGKKERNGYIRHSLNDFKKRRLYLTHRLVIEAFIGPPPENHVVDHINGIRSDNRIENLQYLTQMFNAKKARYGKMYGVSKMKATKKTPQRYRADIFIYGKRTFIGSWINKQDAYEAFKNKHFEVYGVYPW